jgi:glycosyltransferase involved in cell wall biosynthesis
MSDLPEISGIICTHNRERYLEKCILSLLDQSLSTNRYEILVIDNGSTDSTKEICDRFIDQPNFRYLFEPILGLSQARNTGWQQARGKYVGYIDDDAVAVRTWFEKALWSFEHINPLPEWVGGPIDLEWEVNAPPWITDDYKVALGWLDWGERERFLLDPPERLGGGNSFYHKVILEKMRGFDTRLGRKKNLLLSGEETQFQHRLKAIGGRLYYHPGIRIHHFVPKERTKPLFFYKRYYWGGITDYLMSKSLQDISFESISQNQEVESQATRLLSNSLRAIGLFVDAEKIVQSRIYLSYVLGRLVAVLRYGWRKMDMNEI